MIHLKKYLIPVLSILTVALFIWLFKSIVLYIIIAMVLALLGLPIIKLLDSIKIKNYKIPIALSSVITLATFIGIVWLFGYIFLPPIIKEIKFLSQLNMYDVIHNVLHQYPSLNSLLLSMASEEELKQIIASQLNEIINLNNMSLIFNNILSYAGTIVGGIFSVLFITFFFLKDEKMVVKSILLITPSTYEEEMLDILRTSKSMLSRYFTGLFADVLLVTVLVTLLMWVFGVNNPIVIGFVAGLLNIIPYIGPLITMGFALFIGVSGCIEYNQYEMIAPISIKIVSILLTVKLLDALLFQPFIFSNTVKAHPLEIFLVILMAGSLAGIFGMVVAIPVYTLIRIVAREFLAHLKFFKKLTEKLTD